MSRPFCCPSPLSRGTSCLFFNRACALCAAAACLRLPPLAPFLTSTFISPRTYLPMTAESSSSITTISSLKKLCTLSSSLTLPPSPSLSQTLHRPLNEGLLLLLLLPPFNPPLLPRLPHGPLPQGQLRPRSCRHRLFHPPFLPPFLVLLVVCECCG